MNPAKFLPFHFVKDKPFASPVENNQHSFSSWQVRVGDHDLDFSGTDRLGMDLGFRRVNVHPKYNKTAYYDVAIITTESVDFSIDIQPVCLPSESSTDVKKFNNYHVDLLGLY